jgi:hypothetical protein
MKNLAPLTVAETLETAATAMNALAHDIRQRFAAGYSNVDPELSESEMSRLKEIGDSLEDAMEAAYHKAAPGPRPVDAPPVAAGTTTTAPPAATPAPQTSADAGSTDGSQAQTDAPKEIQL